MRFHGKVIDEDSGEPVAAASVYFNTSIGTIGRMTGSTKQKWITR